MNGDTDGFHVSFDVIMQSGRSRAARASRMHDPPNAHTDTHAQLGVDIMARPLFPGEAVAAAEPVVATEVLAEDATEPDPACRSKRSRAYEAFAVDPADEARCVCLSNENIFHARTCGESLTAYPSTLWYHLRAKHPRLHQALKGKASGSRWLGHPDADSSSDGSALNGSVTFPFEVSYRQMVDSLCRAPPKTIEEAISTLQRAKEQAEERAAFSMLNDTE